MSKPTTIKPGKRIRLYGEDWIVCRWHSNASTEELSIRVRPAKPKKSKPKKS